MMIKLCFSFLLSIFLFFSDLQLQTFVFAACRCTEPTLDLTEMLQLLCNLRFYTTLAMKAKTALKPFKFLFL